MLIHDGIFSWEGFGGLYQLAAGRCRLRIFDLTKENSQNVAHIKPIIVVVSDLPDQRPTLKKVSVRSCASHVATKVAGRFNIDPQRMVYVEYAPRSTYGDRQQHVIPAKYDAVDFEWHDDKAMHPKWRPLLPPMLDTVTELIGQSENSSIR